MFSSFSIVIDIAVLLTYVLSRLHIAVLWYFFLIFVCVFDFDFGPQNNFKTYPTTLLLFISVCANGKWIGKRLDCTWYGQNDGMILYDTIRYEMWPLPHYILISLIHQRFIHSSIPVLYVRVFAFALSFPFFLSSFAFGIQTFNIHQFAFFLSFHFELPFNFSGKLSFLLQLFFLHTQFFLCLFVFCFFSIWFWNAITLLYWDYGRDWEYGVWSMDGLWFFGTIFGSELRNRQWKWIFFTRACCVVFLNLWIDVCFPIRGEFNSPSQLP